MAQIFHKLISVEEAISKATGSIGAVSGSEMVKIDESLNRILSETLAAPIDSPPYDRSIVDGYAVRSSEVEDAEDEAPIKLKISGTVNMGIAQGKQLDKGECLKIPTGGYVPEGCDSVVMVEHTKEGEGYVEIFRSVKPGENIARAGSDIAKGTIIMRKGTRIGPKEISVLAALGYTAVRAFKKIRIGIISTGDELVKQGDSLVPGKLYESNSHSVKALLDTFGIFDSTNLGIVPDDEETIRHAISDAAEKNDIVVVSGSTSAGEGDMVYRILEDFNPGIQFHGLQIKPGMPTLFAMKGKKPIIGLPGFPVSAIMVFRTIFLPPLLEASHFDGGSRTVEATLPVRINIDLGKMNLIPVSVIGKKDYVAYPMLGGSGSISRVLHSDGYISIQGDRKFVEKGELVKVALFNDRNITAEIVFAGSYDPVLEDLFSSEKSVKIISTSTRQALEAVRRGEADIAAVNIFDKKTGTYNRISDSSILSEESLIVKGFKREVGLMVLKGNPLDIRKLKDIEEKSAKFVNLERSSGARSFVDFIIENEKLDQRKIKNFDYEVGSLNSDASTIEAGKADVGIGTRSIAVLHGLDFIPLSYEDYDFVIRKESREKLARIIEGLSSQEFRRKLNRPGSGYKI